jgi:hypothetical protein
MRLIIPRQAIQKRHFGNRFLPYQSKQKKEALIEKALNGFWTDSKKLLTKYFLIKIIFFFFAE